MKIPVYKQTTFYTKPTYDLNILDSKRKINGSKIFYLLLSLVILFAVSSRCLGTTTEKPEINYTTISVQDTKMMIDSSDVFILDVRTQEEYDAGHINGSTLIPVQVIETRLDEIPKDRKILVYCRSGGRSSEASQILIKNGFEEIYNMNGGIDDWIRSGFEVVK